MRLIQSNIKQLVLIIGMYFISIMAYAQSRAIFIANIGPADSGIPATVIYRDSNDVNIENLYELIPELVGVYGINYSNNQDFDLLECILKVEVKETVNNGNMSWNNFRIVFLDDSFKITDERYICCDKETAKVFGQLLKLKSVSSNLFISNLFLNYIEFIEMGQSKTKRIKQN